jgi:hypothetical protein
MQKKGVPSMFKSSRLIISVSAVVLFSVAVWTGTGYVRGNNATSGADHVRWDIINVDIPITTVTPGGVAFASADATHMIKLTGSGTFVAPLMVARLAQRQVAGLGRRSSAVYRPEVAHIRPSD